MSATTVNVKVLGSTMKVMCDALDCGVAAKFLFRIGAQRIHAYCIPHAKDTAARLGVELPDAVKREEPALWCGARRSA